MIEKPVFILGVHKSGTSLLRNLLDGHSAFYTNPIETNFFYQWGNWTSYEYRARKPKKIKNSLLKKRFIKLIKHLNERDNIYSDGDTRGIFDIEKFQNHISKITPETSKREIMGIYFDAVHYSITGEEIPAHKRVVHKAVGLAEFALELRKLFPQSKFIHIVRNPYSNIASYRKFYEMDGKYPLMSRMIAAMENNFYFLYKNKRLLDNYYVIRYEDLVSNPEAHLPKIAEFLGIEFKPILLKPTALSKPWEGNSTTDAKFSGIDASHLQKWKKRIHPMEVYFINNNFQHILRDFNYTPHTTTKSKYRPAKSENLKRYLYNRLFIHFNRDFSS